MRVRNLLFIALVLGLAFVSCKKDKDDKDVLVGTWRCTTTVGGTSYYDEFIFNGNGTGSWKLVAADGAITEYEIVSWTATSDLITASMKLKGTTDDPTPMNLGYSLYKDELTLSFGGNTYLYLKR